MLHHRHLNCAFGAALLVAAWAAFDSAVAQTGPMIGGPPPGADPAPLPPPVDASLSVVTHLPGHGGAISAISPFQIAPVGQIASLSELAASPANRQALSTLKSRQTQKPVHRLPNGH